MRASNRYMIGSVSSARADVFLCRYCTVSHAFKSVSRGWQNSYQRYENNRQHSCLMRHPELLWNRQICSTDLVCSYQHRYNGQRKPEFLGIRYRQ